MYGAYLPKKPRRVARPRARARCRSARPASSTTPARRRIKALREEGIATVLVNPNIATIQTSEELADRIYLVGGHARVRRADHRARRRSTPSLLSFGGQTALNCGLALHDAGVLDEYGVRVLGTPIKAIRDTEDRQLFVDRLDRDRRQDGAQPGVPDARGSASRGARDRPPGHAARRLRARRQGQRHRRDRAGSTRRCGAPSPAASQPGARRGVPARLEGDRVRGRARRARQLHHRLQHGEPRPDGHPHGRVHRRRPVADAQRRGVPAPADASRSRRCATSASSASATSSTRSTRDSLGLPRHRGQRAPVALERAREQGDRLSARLRRRQDRPRLHAAGDPQRASPAARPRSSSRRSTTSSARSRAGTSASSAALDCAIGSEMKSVGEVMAIGRTFPEVLQKALRMLDIGVQAASTPTPSGFDDLRDELRNATPLRASSPSPRRSRDGVSRRRDPRADPHRPLVPARDRADRRRLARRLARAAMSAVADELLRSAKRARLLRPTPSAGLIGAPAWTIRASARKRHGHRSRASRRSTRWPPSFPPRPTTSTRPTTRDADRRGAVAAARRSWCSARASTASARASSSTGAASTRSRRPRSSATRPSCSTTTRRRSAPTTTSATSWSSTRSASRRCSTCTSASARRRRRQHGRPGAEQPRACASHQAGVQILGTSAENIDRPRTASKFGALLDRARHRSAAHGRTSPTSTGWPRSCSASAASRSWCGRATCSPAPR